MLNVAGFGFFFFRDNFATHYPFKVVSATAWRAGSIPWWNPTDGGGQPLAGNPNALTLDRPASGLSQGCIAQTCLVEVARFDGEPPPVTAFKPPALQPRHVG